MVDFGHWKQRLEAADGVIPDRIRVTRKSSREENKQRYSHEQQMAEMTAEWGEVADVWWWRESRSGTSFDRPTFQDVLDFCTSNPRPDNPGRVEWWAPHRFGRSLGPDGQPDILKFMAVYHQFENSGWQLHFLKVPRMDHSLGDVMNIAVHAYAAAVYSRDLSDHASRGRRKEGEKGWWVNSQAPWGTKRKDTKEDRVLEKGENSTPGGGGTILVGDPEVIPYWESSAKRFLEGASYKGMGEELYDLGLRGPQGGALGHRHMKNFLTNRHLIGEVKIRTSDGEAEWVDAQWDALVDVDLFEQVQEEVRRREAKPRNKKRTSKGTFILHPVCSKCGIEYHGGRNGKKQGNARTYVHPKPNKNLHPEVYEAYKEHDCRGWTVLADELETAIKDLILEEKTSEGYEEQIRGVLLGKEEFEKGATEAMAAAELRVETLEADYRRQMRKWTLAEEKGLDDGPILEVLEETQQKLDAARAELERAQDFAQSQEVAWDRLSEVIDETRNLAEVWDKVDLEERRVLLDWWVLDVMIAVEPVEGMKRKNEKSAIVTLRTTPDAPRYFALGARSSAVSSSSRTNGSSSDSSADRSASTASEEPTRPRAQAECPRTNGDESDNDDTRTGTASGDAQLPKATATLRKNPERPARRIAEPRENDSQADSSMAMSSTKDGESVPACQTSDSSGSTPAGGSPGSRGAYSGSEEGGENLRGNGHTSWEVWQPYWRG